MSINRRLQDLLDRHHVKAEVFPHEETITAKQAARKSLVAGRLVAKAVVLRVEGGRDLMMVVPASCHVDPIVAYYVTGRTGMRLEDERELARLFPDCEIGAMPPIGHLYGLETHIDPCLIEEATEIWFQAGNHRELVRMNVEDFVRIAEPFQCHLCLHREAATAG